MWLAFGEGGRFYKPGGLFTDADLYMRAAANWRNGLGFYPPYQLAGPYVVADEQILYPPAILAVLLPFAYLPVVAFAVVPSIITLAVLWWHRPSPFGWLIIAVLLALPVSIYHYLYGNPGIWVVAAVALATRWPAVGPWVLLKPSLFPFALVGIRRRSWWLMAALEAALVVLTLPLWRDWTTVMLNARGPLVSPLYSLSSVPLMCAPLVAWRYGSRKSLRKISVMAIVES